MSSTGRGPRLGGPEDFFRTPSWAVRRRLEVGDLPGGLWLEPGAGDGAIIRAVNAVRTDVKWIAWEIRQEATQTLVDTGATVKIGDFLTEGWKANPAITVVVGNPPYQDAQEFIERSREVAPAALVTVLLRTNFTGSEERADFMRKCAPDVGQLPNRPPFYLRQTDSIEYAWLTWYPGERRVGSFHVLASTPLAERQRDMPPVGKCPGTCAGLGWLSAEGLPVKKKTPGAHPCPRCFGFGKVETGLPPSMLVAA